MRKVLAITYGALVYALGLAVFLYLIGFVGNLAVPRSIDSGPATARPLAVTIDLLLLLLFGLQHSVMARRGFKRRWTRIVPGPVERSTFVLATSLVLILLFWQWRPMDQLIWEIGHPAGKLLVWALFWSGWCLALLSTFVVDHFDLFGLRQSVLYARGEPYRHPEFQVAWFYRYTRHPLLLGLMIAFWSTPRMTAGHLLFAGVLTAYMLVAIQLEERDLLKAHGEAYRAYRRRVPMLLPGRRRGAPGASRSVGLTSSDPA